MSIRIELDVSSSKGDPRCDWVSSVLDRFRASIHDTTMVADQLHGSARTTREQRKYIQQSDKSQRQLALELGIDPKTVAKWQHRSSVDDAQMGPRGGKTGVLTAVQKDEIRAYCSHRKAPLDALLLELKRNIPHLTRSTLYRCLREDKHEEAENAPAKITSQAPSLRLRPDGNTTISVVALHRG